eukprot:TRINITY_DN1338_c0_g1_i1.p1 TRINITY_DN1338_c0_g1~~TRINITY_DN1338_c0_g1_i1.p1  ORF type:complete len:197 (-),score=52.50 TRINITY_DN1338_c0_g1_i1:287-877(-)
MFTARKKIVKANNQTPTDLEDNVAQALFDLQETSDLKADLKDLNFVAAKEIDVAANKKALVIFIPFVQLKQYRKFQYRLTRELEKKFAGRHVVFVAQRKILPAPSRNNTKKSQKRPNNRSMTSVHEAILDDLVYPVEITGKRTRYRTDGSKYLKVHLDLKEKQNIEYKVETFSSVYKALTGQKAVFEFPVPVHENA